MPALRKAVSHVWTYVAASVVIVNELCVLAALLLDPGPIGSSVRAFQAAIVIISNGAFLLPACKSWYRMHYTYMMFYVLIPITSSMYHTCYAFEGGYCPLGPTVHAFLDFLTAQIIIPLTALYLVRVPSWAYGVKRVIIISSVFVIGVVQYVAGRELYVQMVIALASLLLIVGYWIVYNVLRTSREPGAKWEIIPSIYRWTPFCYCICLTAIACALFVVQQQSHTLYWAIHSQWHTLAALAQYFLMDVHREEENPARDGYSALDKRMRPFVAKRIAHSTPKSRVGNVVFKHHKVTAAV